MSAPLMRLTQSSMGDLGLTLVTVSSAVILLLGAVSFPPAHSEKLRIIGGTEAVPHEFPFLVWILSIDNDGDTYNFFWNFLRIVFGITFTSNCAGTILTEEWVVTAAHCVAGLKPSSLKVYAGVHDRRDLGDRYQKLVVRRIVIHHKYDVSSFKASNDIALLHLESKVRFNEYIKPLDVDLSVGQFPRPGSKVTVPGWGLTKPDSRRGSDKLMKLSTTTVSTFACKRSYKNVIPIDQSHLCTNTSKSTGSCFGDSGSPVLCNLANESITDGGGASDYALCGIVSGGIRCADPVYYQVNTNVPFFVNWIKKHVYNRNNFVFET